MVPVSQGEQVAGFRRYGFVGRVTLGGMVAVLVAASATLSGCVSNSEGSSAVAAPGSAVEDSAWDDVELTLVNNTDQQFTASATVNCDVPESQPVGPGKSATFSPSSCSGIGGDVREGKIEMKGVDNKLVFTADNGWKNGVSVKFATGEPSEGAYFQRFLMEPLDTHSYCMKGWKLAATSYEKGSPRKITMSIGRKQTTDTCKEAPIFRPGGPS